MKIVTAFLILFGLKIKKNGEFGAFRSIAK